jgi:hypothetical protein
MSASQRVEVRGLVPRVARPTVDPSQTPGGEDPDPRAGGEVRGGGDRRGPVAAARDDRREVAHAALDYVPAVRDVPKRRVVEADPSFAGQERHRGRHRPAATHSGLDLVRDPKVARPREPVADQRALERHDGSPLGERVRHLGRDPHEARLRPLTRETHADRRRKTFHTGRGAPPLAIGSHNPEFATGSPYMR